MPTEKFNIDPNDHEDVNRMKAKMSMTGRIKKMIDMNLPMDDCIGYLKDIAADTAVDPKHRIDAIRGVFSLNEMLNQAEINDRMADSAVEFVKNHDHNEKGLANSLKKLQERDKPVWEKDDEEEEDDTPSPYEE